MAFGILLAAGQSQRFGTEEKKQFASLAGKPVLVHCLERFDSYPQIDQYLLVGPGPDLSTVRSIGKTDSRRNCIDVIAGGDSRRESVRIGLEALSKNQPTNVMVHDVARPLVPTSVIARLLERQSADDLKGVVPALNPDNTIKTVAEEGTELIEKTLDRSKLRSVQTPQLFHYETLLSIHRNWSEEETVTDDAMMLEESGYTVGLVEGSRLSTKITYQSDLAVLETFLEMEDL